MPINSIPISARNMPYQSGITTNGSYNLPQQGFVPPQGSRPLASGKVGSPDGYASNPGFLLAGHVDAGWLPAVQCARPFGIISQTAQIQMNTSMFE